ncbi:MAG: enoyl-CoA hydratase/isomerase family protein, partial [Actinobacteria bacterium]|nr:enoyl-CoA hydratase/isomerase family protein [Actinomycetota bacterium]
MPLVDVEHPAEHITLVTLQRPDRLNAMSIELMSELYEAIARAGDDNDCRVIVLTGAGRAFCSGLDLKDYGVVPNIDGLAMGRIAQRSMRHYSRIIPLMRSIPQPLIAAINGPAYGGGLCLTLGADLRLASPS